LTKEKRLKHRHLVELEPVQIVSEEVQNGFGLAGFTIGASGGHQQDKTGQILKKEIMFSMEQPALKIMNKCCNIKFSFYLETSVACAVKLFLILI
jgi:hypothetical protein